MGNACFPASTSKVAGKRQGSRGNSIRPCAKRTNRYLYHDLPSALSKQGSSDGRSEKTNKAMREKENESRIKKGGRNFSVRPWRQGCTSAPTANGNGPPAVAHGRSPLTDYWRGYFQSEARRSIRDPQAGGMRWNCGSAAARDDEGYRLTMYDGSRCRKIRANGDQVRARLQEYASIEFTGSFDFRIGQASENLDGAPEGVAAIGRSADGWKEFTFCARGSRGCPGSVMKAHVEAVDVVEGTIGCGFGGITPPSVRSSRPNDRPSTSSTIRHPMNRRESLPSIRSFDRMALRPRSSGQDFRSPALLEIKNSP